MKIVDIQWHHYRLPFLNSFTTAHGVITAREGIIVQITTENGISGIGEIVPLPNFTEWAQHPLRVRGNLAPLLSLLPTLAKQLHHKTLDEALGVIYHAPLLCGLEIALLDVLGKANGYAVSTLLSPVGTIPRASVPVNAVIGASTTEAAVASAMEAKRNGFHCVKLKLGRAASVLEEVERVAAVRSAIGPSMHLRLDANEAWSLEEAIAILSDCASYDIQYVEQPLKADDLAGMRILRQSVPIPIAVDEALHGLESAQLILDCEAADILIIKPQLAGGLRVGQQIIQAAAERGVSCVITSVFEAGIGLAAALHLAAASPAVTLECGLATLPQLIDDLVLNDMPIHRGFLTVPTGPGLGIALDWEALNRYKQ